MKGKLYGIGVGPGDSELMTVKAARIVGEADIIITPKTEKKDGSVALDIASPYIQEHTEIVPVVFPMVLMMLHKRKAGKKQNALFCLT